MRSASPLALLSAWMAFDSSCVKRSLKLSSSVFDPHQLVVAVLQNLIAFLGFTDQPVDLATERLLDVGTNPTRS